MTRAEAAANYKPKTTIRVLFVAEAPPVDEERYFYFEGVARHDWLWIALMKALYPSRWRSCKQERLLKSEWLARFRNDGCWLIDAVTEPLRTADNPVAMLRANVYEVVSRIRDLSPEQIVLVKSTVHAALFQALREAHLNVVNEDALPFPACGGQKRFHQGLRRLIENGSLRFGREFSSETPDALCGSGCMRKVRYAVAMSLDGYIAGPNGEYDWIGIDPEVDFAATWARYDTLLMGRRTYELAVEIRGEAAFAGINSIVFSRTLKQQDHPRVTVVPRLTADWVRDLKAQSGKDIWLFGGSKLFRSFLDCGLVDSVEVAVIPVLLGAGIRLLPPPYTPAKLRLVSHHVYRSGRVSLAYDVQQ